MATQKKSVNNSNGWVLLNVSPTTSATNLTIYTVTGSKITWATTDDGTTQPTITNAYQQGSADITPRQFVFKTGKFFWVKANSVDDAGIVYDLE